MQHITRPTAANRVLPAHNCTSNRSSITSRRFALPTSPDCTTLTGTVHVVKDLFPAIKTFRRCFSTTHASSISQYASTTSRESSPVPGHAFSPKSKELKPSRKSQIRQSLRDWSERNETLKQQALPSALPFEGKVSQLPNALFIGQSQKVEESFDEETRDETASDGQTDNESTHRSGRAIRPGTLMFHRSPLLRAQNVIYLGDIGTQSLLVLQSGRWAVEKIVQKRVAVSKFRSYLIQDFLTVEEIDSLKAHMPRQDVTRAMEEGATPQPVGVTGLLPDNIFAPILQKFNAHRDAEQRFLRNHRPKLHQMYDSLALDNKWRTLSLKEVALLTLGVEFDTMTEIAKKAFVGFANVFHPLFVPTQTAETLSYLIGPRSLDEDVKQVQEWARQYQEAAAQAALGKIVSDQLESNPLSSFIDKARRMILKSRQIRAPTSMGIVGPATKNDGSALPQKQHSGEGFNADDTRIINYMWDVAMRRPVSHLPRAHASLIVRAIGAYPNMELAPTTLRMLLQELGCIEPWKIFEDFNLPLFGAKASWALDQLWHEAQNAIAPLIDAESKATTFPDSMTDMRKDWGELEALCIDKSAAVNIEDAISIEPAKDFSGGYWLHAHFAHPTAHLDVNHPVVQVARKRGSAYHSLIDGKAPQQIVPAEVIRQFTLDKSSSVLTVSTLLAGDGRVYDIQVAAGTIKCVKRLDKNAVSMLMNSYKEVEEAVLIVGRVSNAADLASGSATAVTRASKQNLDHASTFLPKLNLMQELLTARRKRRATEVTAPARFRKMSIPLMAKVTLPEAERSEEQYESYHWHGDPGIILRGDRTISTSVTHDEHRADDVVAQSMRLASESLGKWLADRKIPVVFLGSEDPSLPIEKMNEMTSSTEIALPMFIRTPYPRPLLPHNMQQYAGCTSPLRKFIDMIAHFQADSYLKAVANGSVAKNAPIEDDSVLAFTKAEVEEYLAQDISAGDTLDDFSRESTKVWLTQALFRAFHFKEATLPDTMEMLVQSPARRNASGEIQPATGSLIPWGAKVELESSPEGYENSAKFNEFLPIKLVSVDPARGIVAARATGLPTSEQMILGPVRCYSAKSFDRSMSNRVRSELTVSK